MDVVPVGSINLHREKEPVGHVGIWCVHYYCVSGCGNKQNDRFAKNDYIVEFECVFILLPANVSAFCFSMSFP